MSEGNENNDVSIKYDINTMFEDINVPVFIGVSTFFFGVEQLISHPLEVIGTRLKANRNASSTSIIKNSTIRSLYVGFVPATVGHLPGNLIYILSYTFFKDRLQKIDNKRNNGRNDGTIAPWVSFSAAMMADISAVLFYCPTDVVVQRLFLQKGNEKVYKGAIDAVTSIVKNEGIRGLYKGSGVAILNSIPASAIWWTSYEHFKAVFSKKLAIYNVEKQPRHEDKKTTLVVEKHWLPQAMSGAISGTLISFVTNPLDVVRTRLQTQTFTHDKNQQYKNSFDVIKSIWQKEGSRGFMKGIAPRWASWTIFSCTSALLYELIITISTKKKDL